MNPTNPTNPILPPLGYFIISLLATWPLITHMQGWVPGFGDWGQNMWALWWTRHSLLSLAQSPFFTNYLFYPEGVTLLFHPLDVSDGLLSLPIYGLGGGDITYNLMILLSFVLGGWGTYLLALYLTHNRAASFIAGMVFIFSPYHLLRIDLGHLNLSTVQWIPFYVLFLLKFVQTGSKRSAWLAVFFLVFTALNSWYYVVYCGLISLAIIFWPGSSQRSEVRSQNMTIDEGRQTMDSVDNRQSSIVNRQSLTTYVIHNSSRIFIALTLSIMILSPLLIPMLRLMGSTTLIGAHEPLRHSADLYSFFVPGPPSTWAGWFEDIWISYAAHSREPGASAYLGYTVLLISLGGLFSQRWRRQVIWWWLVALGFTLLALGPQLQLAGQLLGISMPYQWLTTLVPIFSLTGIPGRFVVMTALALAMTSAYGLTTLVNKQSSIVNRQSSIIYLAVGLLIGLEYLAVPIRLTSTQLTDFYTIVAADNESYSMLDIKWDANFLMHAQMVHGKPLVGGWLARLPAEQAAYLDAGTLDKVFLHLLLGPEGLTLTDPATIQAAIKTELAERNVRYIVDHGRVAGPWLEQLIGWPVVYEDDDLAVYGVDE